MLKLTRKGINLFSNNYKKKIVALTLERASNNFVFLHRR